MKYAYQQNELILPVQKSLENMTLKQLLDSFYLGKSLQHQYRQEGRILLNGEICQYPNTSLNQKEVRIRFFEQEIDWPLADQEAKVVYENPFVLIVHKPAGIIIHGNKDDHSCLNAQVARYYHNHHMAISVRPIHRLDKETQGVVFYAKQPFFQAYFDHCLQAREIKRTYYAICLGDTPQQKTFTIHDPIGKDRHRSGLYRISPSGKQAKTIVHFRKLYKTFPLFECELETGRTHQIRVHLSSHHYPIINDSDYGIYRKDIQGMDLFAISLKFKDPLSHKKHLIWDKEIIQNIDKELY